MMRANKGSHRLTVDIVFRALVGAGFGYMIIAGLGMPETGVGKPGLYPIFVGIIGLTLWTIQTVQEFSMALYGESQARIYDIAFETSGISTSTVWLRTLWIFGIIGTLLLGVWLAGFHLTIPLFLLIYLRVMGKTPWWVAGTAALSMEIPIVLLYGKVINTAWPESVLEEALDISFQDILAAPFWWLF